MQKREIAIIRGGISTEHDVSMATGEGMLRHCDRTVFTPHDIIIAKDGTWTRDAQACTQQEALSGIDVALIALHGTYGEDGGMQGFLDQCGISYAGTGAKASALCMDKALTLEAVEAFFTPPVTTAKRRCFTEDMVRKNEGMVVRSIVADIGFPCVVKPTVGGSSLGVSVIAGASEHSCRKTLAEAIHALAQGGGAMVVEEFIAGREVTCAVVEGLRGERVVALPLVEVILSDDHAFFDYDAKYSGETEEVCPANVQDCVRSVIEDAALQVHTRLGLRDYSRSDFIIGEDGRIVFLEVNTLPGMTPTSFVPQALAACGISYSAFITHLITRADERR